MKTGEMIHALADAGFVVGFRDDRLNQAFKGRYMVAVHDYSEQELPTDSARNIPCVVGDDFDQLIRDAYGCFVDTRAVGAG